MNTMSSKNKKESKFHIITEDEADLFDSSVVEDEGKEKGTSQKDTFDEKKSTEIDSNRKKLEEKNEDNKESSRNESQDEKSEEKSIESDFKEEKPEEEELPETTTVEDFIEDDADDYYQNNQSKSNQTSFHKPYFSFEVRVTLMIIGIFVLILASCFMLYKAIKYGGSETVTYDEVSKVKYKVCLNENSTYQQSCLGEGMQYVSSLVNYISADFQYNVNFSTDIDYDLSYHIVGLTHIYDQADNSKVLYKKEDTLLEKTSLVDNNNQIHIDTSVNINYSDYNKIVKDYNSRYSLKSSASLEIILYLDEPNETRKVSSVTIPLGKDTFSIGKYTLSNINQSVKIPVNQWNEYTAFYGIVATVLLLLSIILIFKTAKLVLKVTNNRNHFQATLSQILRKYDRIIVVARDGYESNIPKKVIKVANFDELLDARDALEKPIIYSKVNSIKSEFIVEDDEKLYKYVLKESDF